MLGKASLMAFVPSTDLDRSHRFYVGTLGLEPVEITPFACVVRSGPTMLRVTRVDELRPQPFTVLGWEVADPVHRLTRPNHGRRYPLSGR
jgi:catechol 2,3-dioxygenase-like lactoylglutathione lyase family enzyme